MIRQVVVAAAASAVVTACSSGLPEAIETDFGLVAGVAVSDKVRAFKGLPFAAPPVGELRWRAPQPVEPWDGVRDASEYRDVCIQPPGQGRLNIAVLPDGPAMSEDCLYLNVWTPAESDDDALPVMLYIFGGAFTEGGGSVPLYDGTALAEKGAVIVTMNYRLGAFGFFAHPELTRTSAHDTSGNYGIMDAVAALDWIQRNIEAFGGDPGNVTVFGQSAGAMAIASLIASPRADGLFHHAIAQSVMGPGVAPGINTLARAEAAGVAAAEKIGISTAEALRAMSADEVVANFRSAGMIVDNYVIPEDPAVVYAEARQNAVDLLIGSNKQEGAFAPSNVTAERFEQRARGQYGDLADDYLALYPHAKDQEAGVSSAETFSDRTFWNARRYADFQHNSGNAAYIYYFAQNPPGPEGEGERPATHASEVPYVFNNIGELPLFPDQSIPELSVASTPDLTLAEQISSYWVNFARSGDPNGPGLPEWPAHRSLDQIDAAILDSDPASESLPSIERLRFFDAVYDRAMAGD